MIKRCFDILLASIGLVLTVPVFVLLAICIPLESKGPILFQQKRVGQYGKLFTIYKFRTMWVNLNPRVNVTSNHDKRITKIGVWLRQTKLDELPQLINVLIGNMSLVGPRPEVPEYMARYKPNDRDIMLSVKPGITDLASIKFRHEGAILAQYEDTEWAYFEKIIPKKMAYTRFYVKKRGFCFDLWLIIWTIRAIFS